MLVAFKKRWCAKSITLVMMSLLLWVPVGVAAETAHVSEKTPDIAKVVLKDMSGQAHVLGRYQGKWLIINYWATWCPPCLEEMPDLVNLYDARKNKDVMVIGVAWDYPSANAVASFVDDMLVSYPIVLGSASIAKQLGDAAVMPTTFVYNPQGKLVKTRHGLVSRAYLEKLMTANELSAP